MVLMVIPSTDVAHFAVLVPTMHADRIDLTPTVKEAHPLLADDSRARTSVVNLFSLVCNATRANGSAMRPSTVTCSPLRSSWTVIPKPP